MGAAAMVFLLAYAISQTMFNDGSTPLVKAWGACSSQGQTSHDKAAGRAQPQWASGATKCLELREHTTLAASVVADTTLTWTYTPATNTVSIAYTDTAISASGWVGWGINLHGTTMLNADVLIGFQKPPPAIATPQLLRYKLTSALYGGGASSSSLTPVASFDDGLSVLQNMTLLIQTNPNSSAGAVRFTILATLLLPPGVSSINTIYNRGPSVSPPNVPLPHGAGQRNGMKTIHLLTGAVSSPGGGGGGGGGGGESSSARFLLKCVHGVLAVLSWGFLLLLGAMAARYMKRMAGADPAWFYAHVCLQMLAYSVGTIAWALGLRLGGLSPGIVYHSHRNLGIAIFVMATLQITALFARPQKRLSDDDDDDDDDHHRRRRRLRLVWEIFHHTNGYAVLLLSIINVFKGFRILAAPAARYSGIYIAVLVAVACACVGLEARSSVDVVRARWGTHKSRPQGPAGTDRDMPPPPPA